MFMFESPQRQTPLVFALAQTLRYRLIAQTALASASLNFLCVFSAAVSPLEGADDVLFDRHIDLRSAFVDAIVDVDVVDCAS